jgi:hypothetical protein
MKFQWNLSGLAILLSSIGTLAILGSSAAKGLADVPNTTKSQPRSPQVENSAIAQISPLPAITVDPAMIQVTPVSRIDSSSSLNLPPLTPASAIQPTGISTESSLANPAMSQVTSVSQFSDVRPTDWAFQALQSLVERYGCIVGYPDKTFRGSRSLTRYEFAAGLNACLDKIQELIAAATADFVKKEDLETVKKLQELFAAELAALRGRVDALEVRTATLEKQQFSTTTKLSGDMVFVGGGIFTGDRANGTEADKVITFQNRARLVFSSSFTGKDSLRLILSGGNVEQLGSWTSVTPGNPPINTFSGQLGTYDGLLADTRSPRFTPNGLYLTTATYRFSLSKTTTAHVFAQSEGVLALGLSGVTNPYFESSGGNNSITRFGRRNAVYDYGDSGPGVAILQDIGRQLQLGVAYTAITGENPDRQRGLFDGRYVLGAQATYFSVDRRFRAALTYTNTYSPAGTFFGTQLGSNLANSTTGSGAVSNNYGLGLFYQVSPKFAINAWGGYFQNRYLGVGDGEVINWAVGFAFPDLLKKGSLGGILIGQEPSLIRLDRSVNLGRGFGQADRDTSLHVEAFYQYRLTDNIEITPGVLWITAPNSDARNAGVVIGLIRTTFKF